MNKISITTLSFSAATAALAAYILCHPSALAAQSTACVECHTQVTPGIASDWKLSKHGGAGVGCAVCHGGEHTTASDVAEVQIPTPETCATCHSERVTEFRAASTRSPGQ